MLKTKKTVDRPRRTFVFSVEPVGFRSSAEFVSQHGQCTVGLPAALQKHLYENLDARPGDHVRLECDGEFIEGALLLKPSDCILVESDGLELKA